SDDQRGGFIGYRQQSFQFAQHTISTPLFRQFNSGFDQVALVHFQFALKAFEQGESVRSTASKTGNHLIIIEATHFFDVAFHYGVAEGSLAITGNHYLAVASYTYYCC